MSKGNRRLSTINYERNVFDPAPLNEAFFRGVSKLMFIIHCNIFSKKIALQYFYQKLYHVEHWYVWQHSNNFSETWALKDHNLLANLWINQEANASQHMFWTLLKMVCENIWGKYPILEEKSVFLPEACSWMRVSE